MKNVFFTILLLFAYFTIQSQTINIPDANFKNALINSNCVDTNLNGTFDSDADTNNDGEIQLTEAQAIIRLHVESQNISSLEGIEHFTNIKILWAFQNQIVGVDITQNVSLEDLNLRSNQLTSLDISENLNLKSLSCGVNQLTELDITQNTELIALNCEVNQFSELDVTMSSNLTFLTCYSNPLINIDLTQNALLKFLHCFNTQLTSLNITQNSELKSLRCDENQLTELDVSENHNLEYLRCELNELIELDVSQNPSLNFLWCFDNELTILNIQNCNNPLISRMVAFNNPNLDYIKIDDLSFSNSQSCDLSSLNGWCKDSSAEYSEIGSCLLSVNEFEDLDSKISINPVPFINNINIINLSDERILAFRIFDITGKFTFEVNENFEKINLSFLSKGVYFVEIKTDKSRFIKKIIKK